LKLIIAGGRHLHGKKVQEIIDFFLQDVIDKIDCIISGKAKGVDHEGELWAEKHNITVKPFPADWTQYGLSAGPKRNTQMAKEGTHLLLIWNGRSSGSANMLENAEFQGLVIKQKILHQDPLPKNRTGFKYE
jgi:hypothetical protein